LYKYTILKWSSKRGFIGWYTVGMRNLFNKTFYRFTLGFIGILIASFLLIAVASRLEAARDLSARVERGR